MEGFFMLIGITGRIGSGKSTVTKSLSKSLNAVVVDADIVSRTLTLENGKALPLIAKKFGEDFIVNNAMDRAKMRELVFTNKKAKETLEDILKPLIEDEMMAQIKSAKSEYVIVDIPLLVGSAFWLEKLNFIVVVDVPENVQIERIIKRNGLPLETIKNMMNAQPSRQEYKQIANIVFENISFDDFDAKIQSCVENIKNFVI